MKFVMFAEIVYAALILTGVMIATLLSALIIYTNVAYVMSCSVTNIYMNVFFAMIIYCEIHAIKSSYSGKISCSEHSGQCSICKKYFLLMNWRNVLFAVQYYAPTMLRHVVTVIKCIALNINHCNGCGKDYCSCME